MELKVQEHRLYICSIARKNASILSYPILKLILARSSFKSNFFCLTVTPDDITLVLDEDGYKELLEDVTVSSQCSLWVAMHATCESALEEGPFMNKLTKCVILPLADNEISVFNISTFQDDFILIKESDLEKAVACLSSTNQVTVIRRGEQLSSSNLSKQEGTQDEIFSQSPRPIKHPFQSPSNRFLITSMHLKDLRHVTAPIMELILFPESSSTQDKIYFFSFSLIYDQISLVLDEEAYTRFPPGYLYGSKEDEGWNMVKIGSCDLGFDECGIVAQISEPLAESNIPLYYISTFYHDHLLVSEVHIQKSLEILKSKESHP